jgi:pyruvate ferredoxin oxidoreductase gamma subunit
MFRIRFHGRGGQGMKTASRILGSAFFHAGYEVQDAPHYGAERRGAPVSAYVRADRRPIDERGIIRCPDLVVVADESLLAVAARSILAGIDRHSILLIVGHEAAMVWQERLNVPGRVLALPADAPRFSGVACAGAAARLVGALNREALNAAVHIELAGFGDKAVADGLTLAEAAWMAMAPHAGCVSEADELPASRHAPPEWIDLPADPVDAATPAIHAGATSAALNTGLWRTLRPVIDHERCNRCWWICNEFCPDSAIIVAADGTPQIDYEHYKGCLICVAQCPPHAIRAVPEQGVTP